MKKMNSHLGKTIGSLTVEERSSEKCGYRYKYWCKCVCGNYIKAFITNIIQGNIKSCKSCKYKGRPPERIKKTGKLYHVWYMMVRRCRNSSDISFQYYGGRGIRVSDRWLSFENFHDDMSESYYEHKKENESFGRETQIERINNDGDYELSNCCWKTSLEQAQNTRKTRRPSLRSIAHKSGIKYFTLYCRIHRYGWDMDKALNTPTGKWSRKDIKSQSINNA